jgi:Serine hydrolase
MMSAVTPFRADATRTGLRYDAGTLAAQLERLRPGRPIIIMIHGYRHAPGHARDCPHRNILSAAPHSHDPRVISWPAELDLDGQDALGLAFGWPARGTIWGGYARAGLAGRQLAQMIGHLPADRPVHIIAHSFGARVALRAVSLLPRARVQRVILLAAAELRRPARVAVAKAEGTDIINICTRDNWFFDTGLAWIIGAGLDTGLGHGLGRETPHWHNLRIDHAATRACLADLGYAVGPARARICHWSAYLRPGAFTLYRALLTGQLPMSMLDARLAHTTAASGHAMHLPPAHIPA